MELSQLQHIAITALEDVKAQDVIIFDTTHLTSLFDRVIIASGTSNRHTKALANTVHKAVKESGGDVYGTEGEDTGEWVLVDLGDIVVHIMQPAIRAYYRLEEVWGDKIITPTAPKKRSSKKTVNTEGMLAANIPTVAPKKPRRSSTVKENTETKPAPKKTPRATLGKTIKVSAPKSTRTRKTIKD
jgi:ribosome-associated protein